MTLMRFANRRIFCAIVGAVLSLPACVSAQILSTPTTGSAFQIDNLQPADQVFVTSAFMEGEDMLVVMWELPPGFYLYRKSISVMSESDHLLMEQAWPAGAEEEDEYFGKSEVYTDRLLLRSKVTGPDGGPASGILDLALTYQGCARDRYCYPMQFKQLSVELP